MVKRNYNKVIYGDECEVTLISKTLEVDVETRTVNKVRTIVVTTKGNLEPEVKEDKTEQVSIDWDTAIEGLKAAGYYFNRFNSSLA